MLAKRVAVLILILLTALALGVYTSIRVGESRSLTVARCVGYCNLSLFVAAKKTVQSHSDLTIRLRYIANPGDHASALLSPNGPNASVTPFTNVLAAFGNGKPLRIIAGSGMNGLALISAPSIKSVGELRGKKIGTFRGDTLELLAYDAVKQAGISQDVQFVYFVDALEALAALRNGQISALTHVEPFVSQMASEAGSNILLRGEDVWQAEHPDCVLVSTVNNIKTRREDLKQLIAEMLIAQRRIETDLPAVAEEFARPFYRMSPADLQKAARSQFPQVDIRDKKLFILQKGVILTNLGYMKAMPTEGVFDFSLLEEVVTDRPELLAPLQHKAVLR